MLSLYSPSRVGRSSIFFLPISPVLRAAVFVCNQKMQLSFDNYYFALCARTFSGIQCSFKGHRWLGCERGRVDKEKRRENCEALARFAAK